MNIDEFKSSLQLPVIMSPMFLASNTNMVLEACKNGVCGTIPSLNGRHVEDFEQMLIEITQGIKQFEDQTGRKAAPFGVNLIVNHTNPRLMEDLSLCIKYKVPLVITSLGAINQVVDAVHAYGGLVFHDIIKKRHAEKAIEAGVDAIIAVSVGAGGHAGTANPFALVNEIRSFYDGTLLLAGAINSGADIAAGLTMGADLVYMGTRFLATQEASVAPQYKQMIVDSGIGDIIYTDKVSGVHANFLQKSLQAAGVDFSVSKQEDFSELSGEDNKAWKDVWSAGQGVSGIHDISSIEELIARIKVEYKAALIANKNRLDKLSF